jgi:hypothetical protein
MTFWTLLNTGKTQTGKYESRIIRMKPTLKERILGGLRGAVVGDALGVPVEFLSRVEVQRNPVIELRGQWHI